MRTSLRALAVATAVAVPAGVTALPANASHKSSKFAACKTAKKRGTTYIVRGTLLSDATATAMVIMPTGGNRHGLRAVGAPGTYDAGVTIPLLVDSSGGMKFVGGCTRITRFVTKLETVGLQTAWMETGQSYTGLKAGDKVLVSWKGKRRATLATLGPAQRVIELRK